MMQFASKRVMAGSPFDFNRAEPSRVAEKPALDAQRAESSQQHVRALNTQFASWVQSQLQNHPDELWEDGVQDYLTHASHIMDKFRDVVDWLKTNAAKAESLPVFGASSTENKSIFETKNNETKFQLPEKSGFGQVGFTSGFTSAWSSSVPQKSQTSGFFGIQNPAPTTHDASDEPDGEDELEQPSSPSVKKSEEKGVVMVHEVKCKLYVKSTDPTDKDVWKDRGMGQLSIKCKEGVSKATKESKPTIVVRNDVGKILLNALLYPGIKTNLVKNAIAAIFHTSVGHLNIFLFISEDENIILWSYYKKTTEFSCGLSYFLCLSCLYIILVELL
ncbi:hypothetical protein AQUCO_01300444v1 [Aquilegia coerulea]|uniref:RanBD1 domain-containing protein n=1 Tax=Aquilegia coerulea TaxID=218851 RepID=A0A2G5E1P0_AQUCA|nr:hypothetical protein AQUCO_01300444v1 [Aquilegia coerulea]